jgi:hypothetical protein
VSREYVEIVRRLLENIDLRGSEELVDEDIVFDPRGFSLAWAKPGESGGSRTPSSSTWTVIG